MKRFFGLFLAALLSFVLFSGCAPQSADAPAIDKNIQTETLARDGSYTTQEDVALYLHLYGELPDNFITKAEARALGWDGGGLEKVAPGKCIGGDSFGNYEGLLPKRRAGLITSAISTRSARTAAARSASCIPATA